MIKCSNCNELIGDNVKECPFCRHIITEEERSAALSANEAFHREAVQKAMEEYSRRVKRSIIVSIILFLLTIAGIIFICFSDVYAIGLILLLVLVFGAYFACMKKFRIGMCPYCESMITGSILFITHCPRCGGRLR